MKTLNSDLSVSELTATMESIISEKDEEIARLNREIEKAELSNSNSSSSLAVELRNLEEEINRLTVELRMFDESSSKEISELKEANQREIEQLRAEHQAEIEELRRSKSLIKPKQQNYHKQPSNPTLSQLKLTTKQKPSQRQISATKSNKKPKVTRIEPKQPIIREPKKSVVRDQRINELQNEIEMVRNQISATVISAPDVDEQFQKEIESIQQEIETITEEADRLEDEFRGYKRKASHTSTQITDPEVYRLQQENDDLRQILNKLDRILEGKGN